MPISGPFLNSSEFFLHIPPVVWTVRCRLSSYRPTSSDSPVSAGEGWCQLDCIWAYHCRRLSKHIRRGCLRPWRCVWKDRVDSDGDCSRPSVGRQARLLNSIHQRANVALFVPYGCCTLFGCMQCICDDNEPPRNLSPFSPEQQC